MANFTRRGGGGGGASGGISLSDLNAATAATKASGPIVIYTDSTTVQRPANWAGVLFLGPLPRPSSFIEGTDIHLEYLPPSGATVPSAPAQPSATAKKIVLRAGT